MSYTLPLAQLIEAFQRLPGIGPKSAQRLAFHILKQNDSDVQHFSQVLVRAKEQIGHCQTCFNLSSQSPCEICLQPQRNRRQICVVSEAQDVFALERTGEFTGLYHVLGGLISPMEGMGPEDLRIRELLRRLSFDEQSPEGHTEPVDEVILALAPSIEGDTTSLYLSKLMKHLEVKLSRIAFGLPVGGDLEYADNMTIARALQGRHAV
jgi:recombination protein RecR